MSEQFYDEAMARRQERMAATADMVKQRRCMLDLLGLKPGERVLDVGSGNGILVREMLEIVGEKGHACGIDGAQPMIQMASRLCPKGEFLHGDATALPVDAANFNAVTASQLLCFVPDVDRALAEMYRVLRPGGRLLILDTDWGSLVWNCRNQALMQRTIAMYTAAYADAHLPRTLSRRLKAAGFAITARHALTVLNWTRDPDTYACQSESFIKPMMEASPDFTPGDWQAWSNDQQAMVDGGEYMFSLNRYLFCAEKPA